MISLVGFMAAGKSTLGPLLALVKGLPFADLDRRIEARAGRPLAEIFAQEGETGFREQERAAFDALLAQGFAGVATLGGGLPGQPGMPAAIRAAGPCLFLDPPIEELLLRLEADPTARPLAAGLDRAALAALHARRLPSYLACGRRVPLPADLDLPGQLDRLLEALENDCEPGGAGFPTTGSPGL
jgi:shikimate kinase